MVFLLFRHRVTGVLGLFLAFKLTFRKQLRSLDDRLLNGQTVDARKIAVWRGLLLRPRRLQFVSFLGIRVLSLAHGLSDHSGFRSIVKLFGLETCEIKLLVFRSVKPLLTLALGTFIRVFVGSFGPNNFLFLALGIELGDVVLIQSIRGDKPFFAINSLEDGLLAIGVSFRVELLDEINEVVFLGAVVDHSLQSLVVGGFVDLHVALLVDPLELRELGVVNHEHHDAGLVYQNLESLKGKLV